MLAPFWSLPHLRVILTYEDPLPCLLWRQPQSSRWYTRLMSRKTGGDLLPSTLLPFFPMAFWCFIALLFPAEVIHLVYKKEAATSKIEFNLPKFILTDEVQKKTMLLLAFEGQNTCLLLLVRPSYSSFCCYGQWLLAAATLEQEAARLRINEEVVEATKTGKRPVATFFSDLKCHSITLNYPRRCYQVMNDAVATWKKRALEES